MPPGAAEMAALEAPWGHTPTEGTELIVGLRASPGGERQPRGRGVRPGHRSHRWGRVRPRVPGTRSAPAGATRRPGGSCGTVTPGRSPRGRPAPPFVPGSPSSLQPCAPACPRAGVSCPRAPCPPRTRLHGPCGRGHRPGAGQRMSSTAPARHARAPPRLVGVSAWPVALALPALGPAASHRPLRSLCPELRCPAAPWKCVLLRGPLGLLPGPVSSPDPTPELQTCPSGSQLDCPHQAAQVLLCSPDPTVPSAPWGLGSDDGVADGCRDLCCLHSGSSAGLRGARRAGGQCGPEAGVDLSTWTPSPSNARARASLVSRWPVVGQGPSLPTPGPPFGGAELATWVTLPCQPGSRGPSTASGASAPSRRRGGCRLRGLGSPAWTEALSPGFVVTA